MSLNRSPRSLGTARRPIPLDPPDGGAVALAVMDEAPGPAPAGRRCGCWRSCSSPVWPACSSSTPLSPSCQPSRLRLARAARAPWPQWLRLSPGGWLAPLIFVNDLLLGLGLIGAIWARHAVRTVILAWAGVWFFAVTVVKLTALDAFP